MTENKGNFGVGIDSVYHTYVYTITEATRELLECPGGRGDAARGLWRAYEIVPLMGDMSHLRESTLAQLPAKHLRWQLGQLGVTWATGGTTRQRKLRRLEQRWAEPNQEADGETNTGWRQVMGNPKYMTPFWEQGLCEPEDFVSNAGDRVLSLKELSSRHWPKKLGAAHGWARDRLCAQLECTEGGQLPEKHKQPYRRGTIEEVLANLPVVTMDEADARSRAREEDELEGRPVLDTLLEEEADTGQEGCRWGWRGSGARARARRRRAAAKAREQENPDARQPPPETDRTWEYRIIDATRTEQVYVNGLRTPQRQWRVRWEGTDPEGRAWEPTWEPRECFDRHGEYTIDTHQDF